MLLQDFLPSPALRDLVRFFGIVHFTFSKADSIPVKAFSPRPGSALYFLPKDVECMRYPGEMEMTKRSSVYIMGQHTLTTQRLVGREFLAIIVHFQPGVLYRLTGVPCHAFTNTCIDADAVFPAEIHLVNEQIGNASTYKAMIAVVEDYLMKRANQLKKAVHGIDAAAQLLLQRAGDTSMDWLAKQVCLCSKQFERKFKERMGVAPSLFARIARFDRAFKMKNARPEKDWLSISLHCGYYDYQHLVRDCKAFTGHTPASFFRLDEQAPERIFGLHECGTILNGKMSFPYH